MRFSVTALLLLTLSCCLSSSLQAQTHYFNSNYVHQQAAESPFSRTFLPQKDSVYMYQYHHDTLVAEGVFTGFATAQQINDFLKHYQIMGRHKTRSKPYPFSPHQTARVFIKTGGGYILEQQLSGDTIVYLQVRDAHGKELMINGYAEITYPDALYKGQRTLLIRNRQVVRDYVLQPHRPDTLHIFVDQEAQPPKGYSHFFTSILTAIPAPNNAHLFAGKSNIVNLAFEVDQSGKIISFEVFTDDGYRLSQKVARRLPKKERWQPALLEGQPVNSLYFSPIFLISK